ncbi:MAG: pyruvate formate-lyase-activating protein [Bacillota bacterium]
MIDKEPQTRGYIHSVETMGTVDNGGIRYVLFMQGCAMRCMFCHNPDTWLRAGKEVTVPEIIRQLLDYKAFFDTSGGGLTVSGGEPLLQHKFVRELFMESGKHGIHRALDTSGYCRHGDFVSLLDCTDLLLFSVKVVDSEKHWKLTGVKNDVILANLRAAAARGKDIVVRYVLIPTVNDSDRDLYDLAGLVSALNGGRKPKVDVLPYNRMGIMKWKQLGLDCALEGVPEPSPEDLARARQTLRECNLNLRTG